MDFTLDCVDLWVIAMFMRPAPPVGDAAFYAFFKHFVGVYFHNGVDYWGFTGGVKHYFCKVPLIIPEMLSLR